MKKSTEIIGLPIISISEGQEIGMVKSLVINPEKGSIEFLTIEHEDWQVSVKAIPFKKVIGIGEYAVTVESDSSVIDLNEIPVANQLVNKKIKITDSKILTRKGQLLGNVMEYMVDEENGSVIGMVIKTGGEESILPSSSVLTYGKDILIVNEDAASCFLNHADDLLKDEQQEETIESFDFIMKEDRSLKNKQIELLEGKRVLKDIQGANGDVLLTRGTILSKDDIVKVQQEGPGVVVGLSMNVEA